MTLYYKYGSKRIKRKETNWAIELYEDEREFNKNEPKVSVTF